METRILTCICCPIGCTIEARLDGKSVIDVSGNSCPRGAKYAKTELTAPMRTLTSTVKLTNSKNGAAVAPVRSKGEIPKERINECMAALNRISVSAPVKIGDTVIENILDTGADIVITRSMD